MLQTRTGKRTAHAALQIAVDMAAEGLISKSQALMRLKPDLIDQLLHPTLDPKALVDPLMDAPKHPQSIPKGRNLQAKT